MTEHEGALPDAEGRERILSELDRNLVVEAAAGTGKTTCLVGRMVALVRGGLCSASQLAAVTFTRKAAAELRARFHAELQRQTGAAHDPGFVGTIHSFCARLLRERPVEAGVDASFTEADGEQDQALRREAWARYVAGRSGAPGDPLPRELARLGLSLPDLEATFLQLADYPDVAAWPAPPVAPPEPVAAAPALRGLAAWAEGELAEVTERPGGCRLQAALRRIVRHVRHADLAAPSELAQVLERLEVRADAKPTKKDWPSAAAAEAAVERWAAFRDKVAAPFLRAWREARYAPALRAVRPALELYDRLKSEASVLSYADLLVKAAALLRDHPTVRRGFAGRYQRLLVDEFQDTDPVQAEVLVLLAADDFGERDWRRCHPRPGSLFVVGDPKQSIYRFRRADLATYQQVRALVEAAGGGTVTLSANFRSAGPLLSFVNTVFGPRPDAVAPAPPATAAVEPCFPVVATAEQAAWVPLQAGRRPGRPGQLEGVYALDVPDAGAVGAVVALEAELIAGWVRDALDRGLELERRAAGEDRACRPADFLILAKNKRDLAVYGSALDRVSIPHEVTGGDALCASPEVAMLHDCLAAVVRPDDPVALVAALRGANFGVPDPVLYALRRARGAFDWRVDPPAALAEDAAGLLRSAFFRLRRYAGWLDRVPPGAAVAMLADDLGLAARAAVGQDGDARAGALGLALEVVRRRALELGSPLAAVEHLRRMAAGEEPRDAPPARPPTDEPLRVMNLHKAKGLEAPVVFLANPRGGWSTAAGLRVDRAGGRAEGWLEVAAPRGEFASARLAWPPAWEALAAAEASCLRAENLRLLYVAATRARVALVVTRKAARASESPWHHFAPHLERAPRLPPPPGDGLPRARPPAPRAPTPDEFERERGLRQDRWRAVLRPTYAASVATAGLAHAASGAAAPDAASDAAGRERARARGTLVHRLLEAAVRDPGADLAALAGRVATDECGGLPDPVEALDVARRVISSQFFARVRAGLRVLAEVPFELPDPSLPGAPPALLRGTLDLVFLEAGGWIVVDWKTDVPGSGGPAEVLDRYAPQLRAYARAWSALTGEPLKEAGVFLTCDLRFLPLASLDGEA